jgi:hypothetical protein
MNCGKSFLSKQIVSHLEDITYSELSINRVEILLISKSEESKEELSKICLTKKYKFTNWKIIHDMNSILHNAKEGNQIIVIFEDMTPFINSADTKTNADMINFLYRSRHQQISILMIMHGIRHSLSNRGSFERTFLDNCSGFFLFKPINNKRVIYTYLKNILDKKTTDKLDQLFDFTATLSSHPYIFIQPYKKVINDLLKIRADIFGKNIIFQSGL